MLNVWFLEKKKKKGYFEFDAKNTFPKRQEQLKNCIMVLWFDQSESEILFGNDGHCIFWAKESSYLVSG